MKFYTGITQVRIGEVCTFFAVDEARLEIHLYTDMAAYIGNHEPRNKYSYRKGEALGRALLAFEATPIDEPNKDPIPEPSDSDLAKWALAQADAEGDLQRTVEELVDIINAKYPDELSAFALAKVAARKATREKIVK